MQSRENPDIAAWPVFSDTLQERLVRGVILQHGILVLDSKPTLLKKEQKWTEVKLTRDIVGDQQHEWKRC